MRLVVGALLLAAAAAAKTTHGTIRCQRSGLGLGRAAARGGETVHDVAATVLKPWNGTRWNGTAPPRHTIVFLLGYAYSGTSAAHWLLGQSPTVSTLRDPDTMSPAKEGWAIDGLKKRAKNRWRDDDDWIPWARLEETYYSRWNLSRPILLENSPPEILHADRLFRQFTRNDTEVRFVLLIRSPCNQHNTRADVHLERMDVVRKIARKYGRRHAFVLRYEDLCNQPRRVPAALEAWLPGLGAGVDVERRPGAGRRLTKKHSHSQKSIPEYCRADFIPRLPYRASLPTEKRKMSASLLDFFDYGAGFESAETTGRVTGS